VLLRSLVVSGVLALIGLIGLWMLPKPDALLSLTAQSHYLSYEVVDPNASTIQLQNARLTQRSDDPFSAQPIKSSCVSGEFLPALGTAVSYQAGGDGTVSISIASREQAGVAATIQTISDEEIEMGEFDLIQLSARDVECKAEFGSLPVWGPGEIGSVRTFGAAHSPSKELLGGEVIIVAKAIEKLFFVIPGATGLYEAGRITLPTGAQIRIDEGGWIGSARLNESSGSLLQVDLSTDNDTIWMWRAGASTDAGAIPIGASAFVRQTRDPGVIGLQIVLAIVLLVTQTVAALAQTVRT